LEAERQAAEQSGLRTGGGECEADAGGGVATRAAAGQTGTTTREVLTMPFRFRRRLPIARHSEHANWGALLIAAVVMVGLVAWLVSWSK
jgi:hypothetical protein